MVKQTLTGTWIAEEPSLEQQRVLVPSDGAVFVSLPLRSGQWERVGPMRAYKDVKVGEPLTLNNLGEGGNVTAPPITEAHRDGDAYIVTTASGSKFKLETFEPQVDQKDQPPSVYSIAGIVAHVRNRFGI